MGYDLRRLSRGSPLVSRVGCDTPVYAAVCGSRKAHGPGGTHHAQMDATAYGAGFERHRMVTVFRPDLRRADSTEQLAVGA